MALQVFFLALAALTAQAAEVSPVEKVVTMLQDLQKQVVLEGMLESKTYDKYACFCKSGSEEKNQAIMTARMPSPPIMATWRL